jgi:hypothetical protein
LDALNDGNVHDETAENTMTTTPGKASSNLPGEPPIVHVTT